MNVRLDSVSLQLRDNMEYEAIVSQFQSSTKKVLCVEDGVCLRIFEESGPFPLGILFEHKQKRWGMTEYFFRYAIGTEDEMVLCVFGRDNAETFCPDFIDDQETSEEEDLLQYFSQNEEEEEVFSDIFTSSSNTDEEQEEGTQAKDKGKETVSTKEQEQHIVSPPIHVVSIESNSEDVDIQENIYDLA